MPSLFSRLFVPGSEQTHSVDVLLNTDRMVAFVRHLLAVMNVVASG